MKRIINRLLLPVLTATAMTLGACSEWTQSDSLGLKYPSFEEQNPELYKQYLQRLREYKQTNHPVTIFAVTGSEKIPGQQNEHLTTVPDSVDFIRMSDPVQLHPMLVAEMEQVRKKGTRILYAISYDKMETQWNKVIEEQMPAPETLEVGDTQVEETLEAQFLAFCKEQTQLQLDYFTRYNFDGIIFTYSGRNTSITDLDDLALYTARQNAFFEQVNGWRTANPDKTFIFEGYPEYLIDKSLLAQCSYILIPALNATSTDKFELLVLSALVKDVPADRFIIGVMTPSATDAADERGYFNSFESDGKTRVRAVMGASQWIIQPESRYTKAGIAITNAQDDYYNLTLVYKNIREAIATMNPTPKN